MKEKENILARRGAKVWETVRIPARKRGEALKNRDAQLHN
jgi:hypothetical protein